MSSSTLDFTATIDAIVGRTVPSKVKKSALIAIVLGLLGFGYGLVTEPVWAWGSFLVALIFVLSLAQGGVIFGVMMNLVAGRWGAPLKRIGEVFGFFLPIGYLLLVVFLIGGTGIYPWDAHTIVEGGAIPLAAHSEGVLFHSKEAWLSMPFFIARQLVAFALLIALDYWYIKTSLRPDLIAAKARLGDKAPAWWDRFIGNAGSVEEEAENSSSKQNVIAVILALTYPMIFSMAAFDLMMSLSPWWYANMFGAWFFVSAFWSALCGIGIFALIAKDWASLRPFVTTKTMHDLGMLATALCMFWAYTSFAQILPIWYSSMPEETDFLLVRMVLPEWAPLTYSVAVTCFLAPFVMLTSRAVKKMKWPMVGVLCTILVGIFLERTMVIMPSIYFKDSFPMDLFLICSVGCLAAAVGLFVLVITKVMTQVPSVTITDERMNKHTWDIHAHSLDAH